MATNASEEALKLKNLGNSCFQEKRYHAAFKAYTDSLLVQPDPLVFGNRAQAAIKLQDYLTALMDCNRALQLNESYIKGRYRRATAFAALGINAAALRDLDVLIELTNDSAAKILKQSITDISNAPAVDLTCVIKGEELRNPHDEWLDVQIECVNQPTLKPLSSSSSTNAVATQFVAPRIFSDFETAFEVLQNDVEALAHYFLGIPLTRIRLLFDSLLRTRHLSALLHGLSKLRHKLSLDSIIPHLHELSMVDDLQNQVLFLDDDTIAALHQMLKNVQQDEKSFILNNFGL